MKGKADLSKLDYNKGGIPETGKINKNRTALFIYDREKMVPNSIGTWFEDAMIDFVNGKIDTIVIDVKKRTWG